MNVPAEPEPRQSESDQAPAGAPGADRRAVDRRTLDAVFGDVLPETTADERDDGPARSRTSDEWYYENRPPHHDR